MHDVIWHHVCSRTIAMNNISYTSSIREARDDRSSLFPTLSIERHVQQSMDNTSNSASNSDASAVARLTNAVASAIAQFQAGQPQASSHHLTLPASITPRVTVTQSNQAINLATPHSTPSYSRLVIIIIFDFVFICM